MNAQTDPIALHGKPVFTNSWSYESPTPFGFSDRPFFIKAARWSAYGCRLTLHSIATMYPRRGDGSPVDDEEIVFEISEAGTRAWRSVEAFERGDRSRQPYIGERATLPADGWEITAIRCDQTGGMCMVDVIMFRNGWCVSLTDEVACLWRSVADWDRSWEGDVGCEEAIELDFGLDDDARYPEIERDAG